MTAGTFETRFDSATVATDSQRGCARSTPCSRSAAAAAAATPVSAERRVHHEETEEQHQLRPIDEPELVARIESPAEQPRAGDARMEAAEPQLRGDHHQAEEQRDCAEQRDTGAIERQSRQTAEDHAGIDGREDREHESLHALSLVVPDARGPSRVHAAPLRRRCRVIALATRTRCALFLGATHDIAQLCLHPSIGRVDTRWVCWGPRGGKA